MSLPPVHVFTVRGAAIGPFIPDAARLRIAVFREWPYLYEGDDAYEREYLRTYRDNPDSLFVIARAGGEVIGLSTGIPLQAETEEVKAPFWRQESTLPPSSISAKVCSCPTGGGAVWG